MPEKGVDMLMTSEINRCSNPLTMSCSLRLLFAESESPCEKVKSEEHGSSRAINILPFALLIGLVSTASSVSDLNHMIMVSAS